MPSSRQASHLGRIAKALSHERLRPFRLPTDPTAGEAIARYAWNVALGEAFYPLLHTLEVVFRNSLHDTIAAHVPVQVYDLVPSWLDGRPSLLDPHGRAMVEKAKRTLLRQLGTRRLGWSTPISPGKLVAELGFGFWTGLLDSRYAYHSRGQPGFWPQLLPLVFPHLRPRPSHLAPISTRFHDIRRFRNRLFHHEPVWNRPDLAGDRERILEAISWISPETADTVGRLDRVRDVLSEPTRRWVRMAIHRCTTVGDG